MAAIYMWFDNEQMVLTTTLYPVEVQDFVRVSADISLGYMTLVPSEYHQHSGDVTGISMPVLLISGTAPDEYHQHSGDVTSIQLPTILISGTAPDEYHQHSGDVTSIELVLKLVIADTPDEEVRVFCDVYPSSCSMTAV